MKEGILLRTVQHLWRLHPKGTGHGSSIRTGVGCGSSGRHDRKRPDPDTPRPGTDAFGPGTAGVGTALDDPGTAGGGRAALVGQPGGQPDLRPDQLGELL